jgi:polyphosphate kinase
MLLLKMRKFAIIIHCVFYILFTMFHLSLFVPLSNFQTADFQYQPLKLAIPSRIRNKMEQNDNLATMAQQCCIIHNPYTAIKPFYSALCNYLISR